MAGWSTALVSHGVDSHGRRVPIVVGVVRVGREQRIAMRVDDGRLVILPDDTAAQLIVNLRTAIAEQHNT